MKLPPLPVTVFIVALVLTAGVIGLILITRGPGSTAGSGTAAPAQPILPNFFLPAASPTPDPCSASKLPTTIKALNDLMRQFDDYAALASSTAHERLVQVVPPMQTIRRNAQDQVPPACLVDLKRYELLYMDTVLQALLEFQKPSPNAAVLATRITGARFYHRQYDTELAKLFGITLPAPTASTPGTPTP